MASNSSEAETTRAIREGRTQFDSEKSSKQDLAFSIDPSKGLSREKFDWFSNGTRFDSSLFTNGDGEIVMDTTATGTDDALLSTSYVGQYVAQALSEPGIGMSIDSANVVVGGDYEVSLDHGLVQFGPFFHDGTQITDGFGFEIDTNGLRFVVKSNGAHTGDSPIPQGQWNINRAHSEDDNIDISTQTLWNWPYGFYNALPLTGARAKSREEEDEQTRIQRLHSEDPGESPLLRYPNLPLSVYVSNEGVADTLSVGVGGMQYTRYGSDGIAFRTTSDWRETTGGTFTAAEPNEPDPQTTPGQPIFAYQRQPGEKDLTMRDKELILDPTATVYLYWWDEYDPATALDGTFSEPAGAYHSTETKVYTNTTCTSYTPTVANFRGSRRAEAGGNNTIDPTSEDITDRVPKDATRVVTAVIFDGSNSWDISLLEYELQEAF